MSENKKKTENIDAKNTNKAQGKAAEIGNFFKENKKVDVMLGFGVLALVLILIGTLGLGEPVVPVCLVIILEAGIAVMLHNVELWVHGIAVIVQIVAGICIHRAPLMILCVVLYVLAIIALQLCSHLDK